MKECTHRPAANGIRLLAARHRTAVSSRGGNSPCLCTSNKASDPCPMKKAAGRSLSRSARRHDRFHARLEPLSRHTFESTWLAWQRAPCINLTPVPKDTCIEASFIAKMQLSATPKPGGSGPVSFLSRTPAKSRATTNPVLEISSSSGSVHTHTQLHGSKTVASNFLVQSRMSWLLEAPKIKKMNLASDCVSQIPTNSFLFVEWA